jgi:hypothetical protein
MARLSRSSPTLHFGPDGGGLVTFLVYPPENKTTQPDFLMAADT